MHDISKGRFEYVGDFMASLNRGPVKLDFGKEAKPLSEKDRARDELNTRNLQLVQRSLVLGTVAAGVCCWLGWQVTKWNYGVRNISEFGEVMRERMPKVSGKMEDSAVGRRLQQASEESRDAISESERLTDWRRCGCPSAWRMAHAWHLYRQASHTSQRVPRNRTCHISARPSMPAHRSTDCLGVTPLHPTRHVQHHPRQVQHRRGRCHRAPEFDHAR